MLTTLDEFRSRLAETEGSLWTVENRIVVGDCLGALRCMPDCSVDLVHTSPPYNIDKGYKGNHGDRKGDHAYLEFLHEVIRELKRVLKPNGSLFWQTGYTQPQGGVAGDILPIDMATYGFFREEPDEFILWDRIIWRYLGGMAFKSKFTNRHETILWYVKPSEGRACPEFDVDAIRERARELDKRNNLWGKNPGNVWEVDRVAYGSTGQSSHIAVYPEEVAEKIVRAASKPGDLVLDPFSGSGTTAKVARSLARRWIGIEISPHYAQESIRRIGFQQPNEIMSLASGVAKAKAFGGKRGALSAKEIARRLRSWANTVSITQSRSKLDHAVERVLQRERGKEAKPEVWKEFDEAITAGDGDPAIEADGLLAADYRQRRNQNGVLRYRSGLEAMETLVNRVRESAGSELISFAEEIAANEPSSYQLNDGVITLLEMHKRLRFLEHGEEQIEVGWLGDSAEEGGYAGTARRESGAPHNPATYQPKLFG